MPGYGYAYKDPTTCSNYILVYIYKDPNYKSSGKFKKKLYLLVGTLDLLVLVLDLLQLGQKSESTESTTRCLQNSSVNIMWTFSVNIM